VELQEAVQHLIGEQIVGAGVGDDGEGIHLYTANGLIIICLAVGILKTETVVNH
jgi:hypothetical protein